MCVCEREREKERERERELSLLERTEKRVLKVEREREGTKEKEMESFCVRLHVVDSHTFLSISINLKIRLTISRD